MNEKVIKKFLILIDKGMDIDACLSKFPGEYDYLKEYAETIKSLDNLKDIVADKDFEEKSLKDIYLRARTEDIESVKKISPKNVLPAGLRPAYLKPLIAFLAVLVLIGFSFTGTLYASADSLPGDILYPVKRTSENIQVAFTPYKYEKNLYLKILEERLGEADMILNQADFKDTDAAESLLGDIDGTYRICRERKYLGTYEGEQLQNQITAVKERFRNRYGIQKHSTDSLSDDTSGNEQDTDTNSKADTQDNGQNEPQLNGNNKTENKNQPDAGEQNQSGNQNQYGR
jgi:hypothetical protein